MEVVGTSLLARSSGAGARQHYRHHRPLGSPPVPVPQEASRQNAAANHGSRPPHPLWRVPDLALSQMGLLTLGLSPEDGSTLTLPNGTDITGQMCDVENYIFVQQKEHNSSCIIYVSKIEKAYAFCNNETSRPAPDPEQTPFPICLGENMPHETTEEVCQDLVNETDLAEGGNGGPAYVRCFLDSSMVHKCLNQCTTKHTKYQFSECLGNCYAMNYTARLIKPTGPPTTPPIPEHLIPLYKTLYNVTTHLGTAGEHLMNASNGAQRAEDFLKANLSNWWNTTTTTHQPLSSGEWRALESLTGQLLPYENAAPVSFFQFQIRRLRDMVFRF